MAVNKIELSLKNALRQAIIHLEYVEDMDVKQIVIEIPKDKDHGDYSTNLAMQLTRVLRRNPREIAQSIVEAFNKEEANVEKIEVAGPGFINLFLRKDAMTSIIKEVLEEKDRFGAEARKELLGWSMGSDSRAPANCDYCNCNWCWKN